MLPHEAKKSLTVKYFASLSEVKQQFDFMSEGIRDEVALTKILVWKDLSLFWIQHYIIAVLFP